MKSTSREILRRERVAKTICLSRDIIRELREWIDDVQAVTAIEEDEDATLYRFYTYYKIPTLRWLSHILHLKM